LDYDFKPGDRIRITFSPFILKSLVGKKGVFMGMTPIDARVMALLMAAQFARTGDL
jgi:hypothetical protein